MGTRYLGGYIGYDDSNIDWLGEFTMAWEKNINTIIKTADKYPQESYAMVVRSIQSEWVSLQRIAWDTGGVFMGVEKIIWGTFLPRLFLGNKKLSHPSWEL